MKKSHFYHIIYHFVFFLCIIFSLSFLSCSKLNDGKEQNLEGAKEAAADINNFFYNSTYRKLMGKGNFFLPDSFLYLFSRPLLKDGIFYTVFEVSSSEYGAHPNFYGLFDYSEIYDCHSDDGLWIDRMFFTLEEERIGSELQKMEEIVNSQLPVSEVAEEAAEAEKKVEEISALEVRSADDSLGFMEFGKEIFIPQKKDDSWIFINASDGNVTRSFYDMSFRCYREERWVIDGKGKEELKRIVETEYYPDSYKTSSKNTISIIDGNYGNYIKNVKDKEDDSKKSGSDKNQFFNEKGFLIKEENYNIFGDKRVIMSSMSLKYNKDDKVNESNVTEYFYSDEKNDVLDYSFNKKYLYKYNSNDIPPDFDYYEDGTLKIRNLYKTADTYTSEIFFGEGFHVKTFYENGKMVKEVFVTNDNNERIKEYE